MLIIMLVSVGLSIIPSRSEWLNQWARSGLPASLPMRLVFDGHGLSPLLVPS